ncbi:DUF3037 domain-containing protein [Spirosoma sp. KNUC1025]|uniref:DUF3037 domain-containing protein n=1 Tax=Spirosoma sp. KNUC1025 TaxID=2894082 RepID=UPI003864F42A|nr:DUF3037 domain-containing protein [Spirosoma sp. KNUC1025]
MPEKHLFEYAIIRFVPRVERQEFLNVGVILYCRAQRFLQAKVEVNDVRLRAFSGELDSQELADRLHTFEQICTGGALGGAIAKLPIAERFRWLTATRSTIIQTSPVHPGLCEDARETLDRLFIELVQ